MMRRAGNPSRDAAACGSRLAQRQPARASARSTLAASSSCPRGDGWNSFENSQVFHQPGARPAGGDASRAASVQAWKSPTFGYYASFRLPEDQK